MYCYVLNTFGMNAAYWAKSFSSHCLPFSRLQNIQCILYGEVGNADEIKCRLFVQNNFKDALSLSKQMNYISIADFE